jgi:ABC-type bacteriocin/lantibiotic exporter with double-glycine peptidase domain
LRYKSVNIADELGNYYVLLVICKIIGGIVATLLMFQLCSAESIRLNVPFVKQEKNGCGAASISMIVQYWMREKQDLDFRDVDAHGILQQLYSADKQGILGRGMERYLRDHGFRTFVFRAEWKDVIHHLNLGRPLIACLKENEQKIPNHFVVITGVEEDGPVLINDPARRQFSKMARQEFLKSWGRTQNWTLLAVPQ